MAQSLGKGEKFSVRNRAAVSAYTTTALSIIVAVSSTAVDAGALTQAGASLMISGAAITASYAELLWAIPCLIVAYTMTLLFHGSTRVFKGVSARFGDGVTGTVAPPFIAGVIMGAVAMALPYVLFPGEVQSEELMATWTAFGAFALIATGLLKAVITPMCLNMGWIGGNFFPSIFAGVAAGYGLAALTGADPMLMVTVTTTAFLAGVIRKPLLVLAVLFLCFPVEGLIWMGLAAIIGAALPVPRVLLANNGNGE